MILRSKLDISRNVVNGNCRVVNIRTEPYDVYIGRPSKWGNPFSHKGGTLAKFKVKNRKEAVDAYEKWITSGDGKHLLNDIHELSGMTLGCWCKPHKCHGDVLSNIVNKNDNKTE